jgi:hypothetical protein
MAKKRKAADGIFRQAGMGRAYGVFVQIVQQLSIIWSVLILLFSAMAAYNTGLSEWLSGHGIPLSFLGFVGVIAGVLLVASFLAWKFFLPSFYDVFNAQVYKHNNPIRRDIKEVKDLMVERLDSLEGRLEELEKKGGER